MKFSLSEYSFEVQLLIWTLIVLALMTQSILIFLSARKREKNPWFWGFIGLLNIPFSAILYFLFVLYPEKKKERK